MSSLSNSVRELIKSAMETASISAEAKKAQKQMQKNQYNAIGQQIYRTQMCENFKGDYEAFASGLKNCIESNYERMGLSCPRHVEDVYRGKQDRVNGTLFPGGGYKNIDRDFP